ncbi:unnamed protein product [Calypogeia fissa]
MAAPRNGDSGPAAPRRGHSSRRSYSSSPARSPPAPSRSPSPRTKRLRRAQEEGDLGRGRSKDSGMKSDRDRSRDRDRDRDRDRNREREKDIDRVRSRDRDHGRDRKPSRKEERPRERRGRDRELERSRDRSRERRGGGRERPVETSPPVRSRRDRSHSPMDVQPRRRRSPSRSPPRHQSSSKHDQRTGPSAAARDEDGDDAVRERTRGEGSPQEDASVAKMKEVEAALEKTTKEKPSFEYSGKLAAETNKVRGVTLQFTEPPEARKPTTRWRLYVFKDGEPLNDPLYIHRQTCYLFGRERKVADIPTDHPSCSKQHAIIQYRLTEKEDADGMMSSKVRPYLMDLGSTNGTMLNSERLDPQRYYEMFEKDTIKFGNSSREYVLLHEHSIG